MEPRYYTVKARAKLAVVNALSAIRRENGYNTSVKHVHRRRDIARKGNDPPELFLWFGPTRHQGDMTKSTNNVLYLESDMRVWYYDLATDDLDLESDLIEGDVQRALDYLSVYDTMSPAPREVPTEFLGSRAAYWDVQSNSVLGYLDFIIRWRQHRSNPFVWDDEDTAVEITA